MPTGDPYPYGTYWPTYWPADACKLCEEGDMPSYWARDVWKVLGAIVAITALVIAGVVYLLFRKR